MRRRLVCVTNDRTEESGGKSRDAKCILTTDIMCVLKEETNNNMNKKIFSERSGASIVAGISIQNQWESRPITRRDQNYNFIDLIIRI